MTQSAPNQSSVVADAAAADVADAVNANFPNQPQHFMKINVDCWERIFDYLSLADILTMMQTCVRMRQVSGYYFRQTFPETLGWWTKDRNLLIHISNRYQTVDFLCPWISHLNVGRELKQVLSADKFCLLKTLQLECISLDESQFGCIKDILINIESVNINECLIHGDFIGQLLRHSPKLRTLNFVENVFASDAAKRSFFQWTHPTIRHFAYHEMETTDHELNELIILLERNSNIKQLDIDIDLLLDYEEQFVASSIHLNRLMLCKGDDFLICSNLKKALRAMYDRGIYKSLFVRCFILNESFSELPTISGLEGLGTIPDELILPPLIHLTKLHLDSVIVIDIQLLAEHSINIEHLLVSFLFDFNDILPFFRYSKKLKTLQFWSFEGDVLNFMLLNKARKELGAKRRVTIYAPETVYLKVKWETKYLNLDLIEIARISCFALFLR